MPRYYFDIENGDKDRDDEGVECRSLDDVRSVAARTLTAIAGEEGRKHDRHTATIIARDGSGRPVLTTTLTLVHRWMGEDLED